MERTRTDSFTAFVGESEPRLRRALVASTGAEEVAEALAEALVIDRLAERGDAAAVRFPPVRMSDGSLDFSFSGLKTAAVRFIEQHGLAAEAPTAGPAEPPPVVLDLCASFRRAVVAALAERAFRVARKLQARAVCVAGGVACNLELRRRFAREAGALGILSHFPPPSLSTDNAAMIAAAGWLHLRRGRTSGLDLTADPDLEL